MTEGRIVSNATTNLNNHDYPMNELTASESTKITNLKISHADQRHNPASNQFIHATN